VTSAVATFDTSGVFVASSFVHAAPSIRQVGLLTFAVEWENQQLISREWAATAQSLSVEASSGDLYSWQWWVSGDQYARTGRMATRPEISVVPALDAVVVRFGHTPEENYEPRMRGGAVLAVLAQ